MATKYKGKSLKVTWLPDGGSLLNLSGSSRNFTLNEEGQEIDVRTRDSTSREVLIDDPEISASLSGLDTTTDQYWDEDTVQIDDAGTLTWYPEGEVSGKRKRWAIARVKSRNFESPHDGPVTWTIGWILNEAVQRGTV